MKLMTTQRLNLKSMLQKRTAHPTCTPAPHALLWHHEATPPLYPPFPRKLLWIQPKPSIITERRRLPKNNKIRQPHNPRVLSDPPFRPCVSTRDHDPTTHETVSQPSHRRGRSSRFGDGLCMEKHRVSCICYLSKTHFVRDFLQNSIGNSSTSTTCNAICIAGTILQLQITMEFHRQLIHQHHLQSHLHCGNDPTVANHNGTLSLTNSSFD